MDGLRWYTLKNWTLSRWNNVEKAERRYGTLQKKSKKSMSIFDYELVDSLSTVFRILKDCEFCHDILSQSVLMALTV